MLKNFPHYMINIFGSDYRKSEQTSFVFSLDPILRNISDKELFAALLSLFGDFEEVIVEDAVVEDSPRTLCCSTFWLPVLWAEASLFVSPLLSSWHTFCRGHRSILRFFYIIIFFYIFILRGAKPNHHRTISNSFSKEDLKTSCWAGQSKRKVLS